MPADNKSFSYLNYKHWIEEKEQAGQFRTINEKEYTSPNQINDGN